MSPTFKIMGVLVAGWLAQTLASTDPDVDAGVAAHEQEEYEAALERFDAAKERLGERPEIAFDRGLALLRLQKLDEARSAFERATEADDDELRSSAHYELGNLEFDAEAYEAAIARYIDALKANPLHANAKWNLELALLAKKKQDEEQEEEQDEEEQDEEEQDEEEQDEEEQEQQEQDEEEQEQEEQEQEQDEQEQDEQEQDEQDEEEQEQDEQEQDEQEQEQDEQEQDEQEQGEPAPAEPQPVDSMDMKRALEKLDEQDPFSLERPSGGYVQPEKDW